LGGGPVRRPTQRVAGRGAAGEYLDSAAALDEIAVDELTGRDGHDLAAGNCRHNVISAAAISSGRCAATTRRRIPCAPHVKNKTHNQQKRHSGPHRDGAIFCLSLLLPTLPWYHPFG